MLRKLAPALVAFLAAHFAQAETKPLHVLLIAGGCCHNYSAQQKILSEGIQARANVQVDVIWTDDGGTAPHFPLYDKAGWAKGYDVIIHDECAAGVKDLPLVQNIIKAHETVPAVNLHCAMHCYRTGTDDWFKYLGLQSSAHNWQKPIAIHFTDAAHPITKGLTDWTTINEELYNNVKMHGGKPLAIGTQSQKSKDGEAPVESVVAWTNEYGPNKTRIFSTTIGHNNETVADARYLDLVTRGLLWSCDKLNAEYLKPFTGKNEVTFIKAAAKPYTAKPDTTTGKPEQSATTPELKPAPTGATLVTVTASSEESGKNNFTWGAVDGNADTRWCAAGAGFPQWLQLEFEKPEELTGIKIAWERANDSYQHKIEGSADGKTWSVLADATGEKKSGDSEHAFAAKDVRFVKITCTGSSSGGWASIREVTLKGPGIKSIYPKLDAKSQAITMAVAADSKSGKKNAKAAADPNDPLGKEGNIAPTIVKLTPEQEAEILKDVKVPEGFDVSLFANSKAANYPVFISSAVDGTLYVSSDGNGSLGRQPHRGRIVRLRDTDGDGRADEAKEFVKDVDSPRGLVWDRDRLYLIHPPDISVYIDKNHTGAATEEKTLIKGIAFGFADRPADHTTNGLELGIDGYLYIAGGDFGFMDAVGTDGRHLQHRGGGVIRFRPDGSGIELVSHGTRNILEVAVGPLMNMFARDNTNDGDGWDVRFHHFTGLENHGYPVFYKNFPDEQIVPLNDYGGGSGCGATFLDEPGFGKWNNAPLTADWGTGALWHHTVKQKGATYIETEKPEQFIKMTRPTDADVDALSHVYQASWKGATFNWAGADVGYIVRVTPHGFKAPALPDFDKFDDAALVKLLESPSHRTRLEAQRTILSRDDKPATRALLLALAADKSKPLATRVAALYGVSQRNVSTPDAANISAVAALASEPTIEPYVLLALGDSGLATKTQAPSLVPAALFSAAMKSNDAQTRLNAVIGGTRQRITSLAPEMAVLLGDGDDVISHTVQRALSMLNTPDACFTIVDDAKAASKTRDSALRSLRMMHTPQVVDGLIKRLANTQGIELRKGLLSALCRLHFTDGKWTGNSWGTRPDYRGPYYQPDPWSETDKIAAALKSTLASAQSEEAAFLVSELTRNRIQFNDAMQRILALAKTDERLIPDAVAQLATADSIPSDGVPLLVKAALSKSEDDRAASTVSSAIIALSKVDSAEGTRASLAGLVRLGELVAARAKALAATDSIADPVVAKKQKKDAGALLATARKATDSATAAFLNAPKLENHHQMLESIAEKTDAPISFWADAVLLTLSARKTGAPEPRELSAKALDAGWQNPKRRAQILKAAGEIKHNAYADKILAALDDPDKSVASEAKSAAGKMKLEKKAKDSGPLIGTMQVKDVVAQVVKTKGDIALGEQLFTRQTCVACHTTSQEQAQKGPYLGNIAETYKRPDLAEAILDPGKTIAQGFATNMFTLKDGTVNVGFVTREAADKVTVRNIAAQESTFEVKDIVKRETLPTSLMPPGLVNALTVKELAGLLDYLESLAKKK
ncbi:MAG: discoidin domain-containing protein [Verrucomicrobiota bacterium]